MTHYWKLDETSGSPYVDFWGTADATCSGACPDFITGIVGNAQRFDGADKVDIPDDGTMDWGADDDFSIEFWMRKSSTCSGNSNSYNNIILGRYDGTSGNNLNILWIGVNCYSTYGPQGAVRFVLRDDAGGDQIVGDTVVNDGEWHHVVALRENGAGVNGECRVYVDGVLQGTLDIGYTYGFAASSAINIGYINFGGLFYYDGDLDELATYNRALTDLEITTHYNRGLYEGKGYCEDTSPPSIVSDPVTEGMVGKLYTYDVNATGTPLPVYHLLTYPAGMDIDSNSGVIQWVPDEAGDVPVLVDAVNDAGSDQQSFTISVAEAPLCPDGLVHYWKLDETFGEVYEDFWNGYDAGCVASNCPTPVTGIVDGAQEFDAVSRVDLSNCDSLNWGPDESFSIEFWMNKATASSVNNVIIGRNGSASDNLKIWWVGTNCTSGDGVIGAARFVLRDNSGNGAMLVGSDNLTGTGWHHIAAVRNADVDSVLLYVDGSLDKGLYYDFGLGFHDNTNLNIGYLNLSSGFHYTGLLDEFAIYHRALTPGEISYHYQYGLLGLTYCDDGFDPQVSVETVEPVNPIDVLPQLSISVVDDRGLAAAYYQLDGCDGSWIEIWQTDSGITDTAFTWDMPSVADGPHTVHFKVSDIVGKANADSCTYGWSFVYDTQPPAQPVVTSHPSGGSMNYLPMIDVQFSDNIGLGGACYQIDGCDGDWIALWSHDCSMEDTTASLQIPAVAEGEHEIFFRIMDDCGHCNVDSCEAVWSFTYDVTAPLQPHVESPVSGRFYNYVPPLRIAFEDGLGIDRGYYQVGGCDGDWIELWSYDCGECDTLVLWEPDNVVDEMEYVYYFKAVDDAGNTSVDTCSYSWSFTYDITAPESPSEFSVEPGNLACLLSWQNPTGDPSFSGVEIRRNKWADGAYPEYDDDYPSPEGFPQTHFEGTFIYRASGQNLFDDPSSFPRNVYFYSIFSFDLAGNYSVLSIGDTASSTNYGLGDVTGDGLVDDEDITLFSSAFDTSEPDVDYNNEFDIGPTHDASASGVPLTDNTIDFEDLMIFAMNYGIVFPGTAALASSVFDGISDYEGDFHPPMSAPTLAGTRVYLEPAYVEMLVDSTDTLWLNFEEELLSVKGCFFKITYDENYVTPVEIIEGSDSPALKFVHGEIFPTDSIVINFAVLDGEFDGPGCLLGIVVTANAPTLDTRFNFGRSMLRGESNQSYSHNTSSAILRIVSAYCGDVNGSSAVDIDDVVYLVAYIFSGGPAPTPLESGDADCSGDVDIDDVVYLIGYIFTGGNAPCDVDGDGIPDC